MNRIIQKTTFLIASRFSILALGVLISVAIPPSLMVAQSTGDRLPTRTPAATTTPTSRAPTPSAVPPSPTPRLVWEGRLVSNTLGVTEGNGSIFRVMVKGLTGVPIEVRLDDEVLVATSGSKSEYGPFTAEFAPLPAGTWTVSVPSLDASLAVTADSYNLAIIEFSQTSVVLPPTATAQSPAAAPSNTPTSPPTNTLTPTQTATPLPTATPSPAPTPITRWLGAVAAREALPNLPSVLVVSVSDVQGVSIELRPAEGGSGGERQCVTGQNSAEFDLCTFEAVQPGSYTVSPEGLGVSLPLTVSNNEKVLVVFDIEVLPSGVTGWQAVINRNTNGSTPLNQQAGRIVVRVDGRQGQVVALHSVRGTEQLCEISFNSLLNDLACEFSGLRPGVYRVNVLHTGVGQSLFIDGRAGRKPAIAYPHGDRYDHGSSPHSHSHAPARNSHCDRYIYPNTDTCLCLARPYCGTG